MTATPELVPGSPEWLRVVTASKVPAILGLSPWDSPLSTWLTMRGDIPPVAETDAMRRGHLLEPGVVAWWRTQHPDVDVRYPAGTYWLDGEGWAAATPDAVGFRLFVEAKTAASDDDWGQPGTDQAPAYYAAQAMWQMACALDVDRVHIPVLFGPRLRFAEYVIDRDDHLIAAMVDACRTFYDTLTADQPPPLDDSVATYEALRNLHDDIDRDLDVDLTEPERDEWLTAKAELGDAESRHRFATSVVMDRMGRARRGMCNGQTVARRQPHPSGAVSLVRVAPLPDLGATV